MYSVFYPADSYSTRIKHILNYSIQTILYKIKWDLINVNTDVQRPSTILKKINKRIQ